MDGRSQTASAVHKSTAKNFTLFTPPPVRRSVVFSSSIHINISCKFIPVNYLYTSSSGEVNFSRPLPNIVSATCRAATGGFRRQVDAAAAGLIHNEHGRNKLCIHSTGNFLFQVENDDSNANIIGKKTTVRDKNVSNRNWNVGKFFPNSRESSLICCPSWKKKLFPNNAR